MENYFAHRAAAKRYKAGRPHFHTLVVNKIKEKLGLEEKLATCLDVACGTGLLTESLLEISDKVIGVDISEGMLSQAAKNPRIEYFLDTAETLASIKEPVDLISTSSAFHWFDQAVFLKTSYAKLKEGACLVIHNNHFLGRTDDNKNEILHQWLMDTYLKKFPSPKRNQKAVSEAEILSIGFSILENKKFGNLVAYNQIGLIEYLITQSNISSHVEYGTFSIEEVKDWLLDELTFLFDEDTQSRNFIFENQMIFLKKN